MKVFYLPYPSLLGAARTKRIYVKTEIITAHWENGVIVTLLRLMTVIQREHFVRGEVVPCHQYPVVTAPERRQIWNRLEPPSSFSKQAFCP